jgi:hypothetical protein
VAERIEFTEAQLLALRLALGIPPGERDPDADDLLAVLGAQQIVRAEELRWLGLDP